MSEVETDESDAEKPPIGPHTPRLLGESFDCPYCGAFAAQTWQDFYREQSPSGVSSAHCFACKRMSIWLVIEGGVMVWPIGDPGGPPPAPDMPDDVRAIYNEARDVVKASPRSAAALLRLALEGLLTGLYPDEGNLNATIGEAARAGLPRQVINAMDVLRFNGNAAIHEISRKDTAETAASLFAVLNLVVTRLVTEPRQIEALHAELPASVRASIEKRDDS